MVLIDVGGDLLRKELTVVPRTEWYTLAMNIRPAKEDFRRGGQMPFAPASRISLEQINRDVKRDPQHFIQLKLLSGWGAHQATL